MILEILQILRDPATVDEDATLLAELIQMSVEWSDYFNAFLAIAYLFNLNLLRVIEDSSELDLLEGVIALELIDVAGLGPGKASLV